MRILLTCLEFLEFLTSPIGMTISLWLGLYCLLTQAIHLTPDLAGWLTTVFTIPCMMQWQDQQ